MIPPRPICSHCLSSDLEWVQVPARGKIISFSEVHVSSENFQKLLPYVVCIASFGDDLKIPGMLKESKNVKVGSEVETKIQPDQEPKYMFSLHSTD
jgi:uncharacterized protein